MVQEKYYKLVLIIMIQNKKFMEKLVQYLQVVQNKLNVEEHLQLKQNMLKQLKQPLRQEKHDMVQNRIKHDPAQTINF